MPSLSYSVVDAFTDTRFQGNPAAVVFGGDELPDDERQRIAREFNLSETVFILRPSGAANEPAVRLRWFTPQCEVSFCGHATLAAVHAFCERAANEPHEVAIQCAAGNLVIQLEAEPNAGRVYWLSMPQPNLKPAEVSTEVLLKALQAPADARVVEPVVRTRDNDLILFLSDGRLVRSLVPDMSALDRVSREHGIRGVSVASTDSGEAGVACISRFFAPAAGIPEDPVTGSVHGPLAACLITREQVTPVRSGHWSFVCRQVPANGRVGTVYVWAEPRGGDLSIEIGGLCVTVMNGQLSF